MQSLKKVIRAPSGNFLELNDKGLMDIHSRKFSIRNVYKDGEIVNDYCFITYKIYNAKILQNQNNIDIFL